MRRRNSRGIAVVVIMSILLSLVVNDALTYAIDNTNETEYVFGESDEVFTAIDADGNVTLIPIEEVEAIDTDELEAIDHVEYEVVVEVDGESTIVATLPTEAEADAEVAVIEEIIEQHDTTEAALEEIGVIVDEIPVTEPLEIIDETPVTEPLEIIDETPVTEPLEIVVETSEDASTELVEGELEIVFSVTSESVSTQSGDVIGDSDEVSTITDTEVNVVTDEKTTEIEYGVVIISGYAEYTSEEGVTISTHGSYAPDAAYLGTESDGSIKFLQSSATGIISSAKYDVYVVDYDTFVAEGNIVSTYTTTGGKLYHNITTNNKTYASTIMVGYQQSYMTDGATYYSYDGYYFYNDYKTMVTDYKNGTYANSINMANPYYNYYQYLSQRSTANYTAEQIDEYIAYKLDGNTTSKLLNTGQYFVEYQNTYGINSILMLGVAINESAWGTSTIAQEKNNLFGHGAYDSNPYYGADGYESAGDSIKYHAEYWMSMGYTDTKDWRYFGANLGDKSTGANVKYASDPYWGEKAAAQAYGIEEYFSDVVNDYNTYQIGTTSEKITVYNEPGGTALYTSLSGYSTEIDNYSVLILGTTEYEGETWYMIQSDSVLLDDRTAVNRDSGVYDSTRDYGYVKASSILLVNDADYEYMLGDPSGDGKISAMDYMMIKSHIMGISTISGVYLLAADVNGDGKISAMDYMMIKSHIMGIVTLE